MFMDLWSVFLRKKKFLYFISALSRMYTLWLPFP